MKEEPLAIRPSKQVPQALDCELVTPREMPPGPAAGETGDLQLLAEYLAILWKNRWLLIATLSVGGIIALAVTLWMIPAYHAMASVEIQNVEGVFANPVVTSNHAVATQAQLLASLAIRNRAVARAQAFKNSPEVQPQGILATVRRALRLPDRGKSIPWETAVKMAAGALKVSPPKEGNVIFIQTDSPDPRVSTYFINSLAEEYLKSSEEARWEAYTNTGSWLTKAQEELKSKLQQSELRLAAFAKSKGLLFTSGTDNSSEDKFKQLQTAVLSASAERIAKEAAYEASLASPTEALPAVLDSGPMGTYQVKLAELRGQLADLSTTLTPEHYKVQQIQSQIDQLERESTKERTNIMRRIRIEHDAAVKRESELRHEFEAQVHTLSSQSGDAIQYSLLLHEVETNRKLYDAALSQDTEASLASAMRTSGARVVDAANVSGSPTTPNLPINLALGAFGGLLCSSVFVIVRVRADMRVQVPGIVEYQLNVRELGVIPAVEDRSRMRRLTGSVTTPGSRQGIVLFGGRDTKAGDVALVTLNAKMSPIAEAFRSSMTSILYTGLDDRKSRVLLFTSAAAQEGKSTVVSNLGIALAEIGHRVLLVDADMRRPRLHEIFDVANTFGLSDLLHEKTPLNEYPELSLARHTAVPGLDVLPAGPARPTLPRLLYSSRLKELFARLREMYDTILVDSPPVLSVPDARSLSRATDAVILVVRAHQTPQSAVFAAAKCFVDDGSPILGTILNGWDHKNSAYGGYHFTGYYPHPPYKMYS
jgi:capsular exopolysaccharide synthesis family protein